MDDVENLTLLLIALTSWKEVVEKGFPPVHYSWKGYSFEVLNKLENEGLIRKSKRGKSLSLTSEGLNLAEELKTKYAIRI
jgi:predicted methyltransferase